MMQSAKRRKYTRTKHTLRDRTDKQFLERWKQLGYDVEEAEYYSNPEVYAPSSSSALHRFANTGRSGVRLVYQQWRTE